MKWSNNRKDDTLTPFYHVERDQLEFEVHQLLDWVHHRPGKASLSPLPLPLSLVFGGITTAPGLVLGGMTSPALVFLSFFGLVIPGIPLAAGVAEIAL